MNNEEIKKTLSTKGWELIEKMIRDDIVDVRLAKNIKSDKPFTDIAVDVLSKSRAANKMERLLDKLEGIKNAQEIKKESYR